ncbi:ABC transporter substrate-binding protein [Chromobacterium sp. IIBBL 290-4]|uniref:ABC transporter substrate-binding protein n=1 Tax=Chromobacterium sp. IIBBL 290-4 TaxID=2953890 RepID=UPI0020B8BAE6|nr:ABC transporter substrate-binding protein [Chromobacterium sp. IIBBL 290-4]UTH76593.1 ABC transporter substrate-binding protein [Chromobacterium sp. IIBBL 290-4]
MKIRLRLTALLCLAAPAAFAAKPLIFCAETSPEGFDPAMWDSASTYNATRPIFQGLTEFERGSVKLKPALAESWSLSPDGLEYTFKLRRGVRFHQTAYFHPSRDFNADDAVFTIQRWITPQLPFNQAFKTPLAGPDGYGLSKLIASVGKVDERTMKIRLTERNATFLSFFAMGFAGMQSAEYADQLLKAGKPQLINQQPIGTGPYRFKSYAKDAVIRYEANPQYWRHPQKTQSLIYAIAADPQVRIQKLKANECQIAAAVREDDLDALRADKNLRVVSTGASNISYLAYNLKRPQFAKREVRVALDIAINRDALFKALFPKGGATQAINPYPPTTWSWNSKTRNEYNPAKAKALLAQAGYPKGFNVTLWALPVQRPTNPNGKLMAQMIQQDWAKIGVKATIQSYEWGEYLKRAASGEHDVYMSGVTSTSGDPDDFLWNSLSCSVSKGGQRFCNAEFDHLLELGRQTSEQKQRAAYYLKAQEIFKRERPWITIAHSRIDIPVRRDVRGFAMNPNGSFDFEDVWRP